MLKNILNLKGAQQLSKKEQQSINGGLATCQVSPCSQGLICMPKGWCCDPATNPSC